MNIYLYQLTDVEDLEKYIALEKPEKTTPFTAEELIDIVADPVLFADQMLKIGGVNLNQVLPNRQILTFLVDVPTMTRPFVVVYDICYKQEASI